MSHHSKRPRPETWHHRSPGPASVCPGGRRVAQWCGPATAAAPPVREAPIASELRRKRPATGSAETRARASTCGSKGCQFATRVTASHAANRLSLCPASRAGGLLPRCPAMWGMCASLRFGARRALRLHIANWERRFPHQPGNQQRGDGTGMVCLLRRDLARKCGQCVTNRFIVHAGVRGQAMSGGGIAGHGWRVAQCKVREAAMRTTDLGGRVAGPKRLAPRATAILPRCAHMPNTQWGRPVPTTCARVKGLSLRHASGPSAAMRGGGGPSLWL